jgi:outer membrane autotransporter protein
VLQADGGRTGTFAANGFDGFGVQYRPELIYNGTQVLVRLAPNSLANIAGATGLTFNQRAVVTRIDAAVAAGYNPQPLFAIYSLPQAQLPDAFDQLSGEVYATAAAAGWEQDRLVREAVLGRLAASASAARATPDNARGGGIWAQGFGSWGGGNGDGNAAGFDSDRQGFVMGIDFGGANENGGWRAGAFGQYMVTRLDIDARGSRAEIAQAGGGIYGGISAGGFSAFLGGAYASLDLDARRSISLPGFAETNQGETDGKAVLGFGEISYVFPSGRWSFRPFLAGSVGSFELDTFIERGGAAALSVARQRYTAATATAGLNAAADLGPVRLSGTLSGRAQLGDRRPVALIALLAAPGQASEIRGVQLDDFALGAGLDATWRLGRAVDLSVGYSGLIGSATRDHAIRAMLSIRF